MKIFIKLSQMFMLTFILSTTFVGCLPLVNIEIQQTQRTNSEATRNPLEINSPQLGTDRVTGPETGLKISTDTDIGKK